MKSSQLHAGVLLIDKARGETLAVMLERVRTEYAIAPLVPLTYAGRLDPMAEGLVLVLVGEKCKEKDNYLRLEKEYLFEVVLGISTDTYDVLGMITNSRFDIELEVEQVREALSALKDRRDFAYPLYSSRTVAGMPLFVHARRGIMPEHIPIQTGYMIDSTVTAIRTVSVRELVDTIILDITRVSGDFRQDQIITLWRELQTSYLDAMVTVVSCRAQVTSGLYIRTIADELGRSLGIPALAHTIDRTKVGEYTLYNADIVE